MASNGIEPRVQTTEEIAHVIALLRIVRLLVGAEDTPDALSDHDRITVADLIVSGWHPLAAAEYARLNYPRC